MSARDIRDTPADVRCRCEIERKRTREVEFEKIIMGFGFRKEGGRKFNLYFYTGKIVFFTTKIEEKCITADFEEKESARALQYVRALQPRQTNLTP